MAGFISAPIFGRYGAKLGSKIIFTAFVFTNAVCAICFGLLTYIYNTAIFLVVAHVIRIVSGIAVGGAWGAISDICMKTFPTKLSKMMALAEMFAGLGLTLGIHRDEKA